MNQYLIPGEIKRGTPQPVYLQIYEQLKRELVLGCYQTGDRFYSYRKLKGIYKTELRTIGAAVDLLIRDGLLEKRATSGIYVIKRGGFSNVGNIWYAVIDEQCYHPFFFNILIGLVKEAEKYGLRIIVRFGRDRKEFLRWFSPRPGEGLVITGHLTQPLLKAAGARCNDNMVVVGNYDLEGDFGLVETDYRGIIRTALRKAADSGCRRFGLVTGNAKTKFARDLREIMTDFTGARNLACELTEELSENGLLAMRQLEKFQPDCVMVTEPAFSGAWEYLMENSLKCPEDVFLIRYGKEANDRTLAGRAAIELEIDSCIHGQTALRMLLKENKDTHKINMQMISNTGKRTGHA